MAMNPVDWMPAPQVAAPQGCPPGLEYLTQVDQLLVHQISKVGEDEIFAVKNGLGQRIYLAHEESNFCTRSYCGPNRGFIVPISDNSQQEVMRLVREFECCAGWAWCACSDSCALEVKVEAPVGNVVGYVKQSKYCSGPKFDVLDAERRPVAKIKGPYCMQLNSFCQGEIDFDVFTVDMATTIGKVFKQRPGCFLKECCTKVENVGVTFPADLDVNVKATLLAAVFFIDLTFFPPSNEIEDN